MKLRSLASAALVFAACATSQSGSSTLPGPAGASRVYEVSEILAGLVAVDEVVSVRGSCVRADEKVAVGPPPSTRSDWQMRDAKVVTTAIWVVGERPTNCGYEIGDSMLSRIEATVARDTLRRLTVPDSVRWYLRRWPARQPARMPPLHHSGRG